MKNIYILFSLLALMSLLSFASADVGLVIEFPNGSIHSECVGVLDGASAYKILNSADLFLVWTDDGVFGRALCMVNDVGSNPIGTTCENWDFYWAFSLALDGDDDWTTHSPVGSTAGDCWNRDYQTPSYAGHYCAKDGDVLGYHYTDKFPSGYPDFISFSEICKSSTEKKGPRDKAIIMSSRPYWKAYCEKCGIEYTDLVPPQNLVKQCDLKLAAENQTENLTDQMSMELHWDYFPKIIKNLEDPFTVTFFTDSGPVFGLVVFINGQEQVTNLEGEISFLVSRGDYVLEVTDPKYMQIKKIFRIG